MPASFAVLASGSSGNATVARLEGPGSPRHYLIDAGLAPRETARRLEALGIDPASVRDILLTHLDADHFHRGWKSLVESAGLTVHVHARHRRAALRAAIPIHGLNVFEDAFALGAATEVRSVLLAHDQLGTVGYVLEHRGKRLGFATDLGRVGPGLLRTFVGLDALLLESNYEPALERESPRPDFLKSRVMGGSGHLSNQQALRAALTIAGRSRLRHLVLLHVSRQCNDPAIIRRLYARQAPHLLPILTIAQQDQPTGLLEFTPPARRQLALFE